MIKNSLYIITLLLFFTFMSLGSINAQSLNDDPNNKVKELGEILNVNPDDYGSKGKPLTSAIMANDYYNKCVNKKSLAFEKAEQEILCGCTAARMSERLTVKEFKEIHQKTKSGKEARGKMLAHSYAPCMDYVIEKKVRSDCHKSKILNGIVIGKKAICKCTIKYFKEFTNRNASFIIMDSVHNNPMTIDPLEDFFIGTNYHSQRDAFAKICRYDIQFKRDNR